MEAKLQQLRRRRVEQSQQVKSITSGATARDVQLVACRLANRLCLTLNSDMDGGNSEGGLSATIAPKSVAAALAMSGGVDAVALIFRMFEATDKELMVEATTLALSLVRGCAMVTRNPSGDASAEPSLTSPYASLGSESRVEDGAGFSSHLLPLLKTLHAPTTCRRIAEVSMSSNDTTARAIGCRFSSREIG